MRAHFALVASAIALFISIPATACGDPGTADGGDYRFCNDYTIHVGDESNGVHANQGGEFLVAAAAAGWYVEQDVAYLEGDGTALFSIWIYNEQNGEPGVQRADEVCNNTPAGTDSDVTIC